MPRSYRIVLTDYPHHITQRGNYKQKTFSSKKDYSLYLEWLQEYSNKYCLQILAYCLMPNHIHCIAIPKNKDSLADTFKTTHMRYAQYFNKKNKSKGHLWQGRFYSCALDNTHLYSAIRYVENNPVKAHLVKKPGNWQWSSARYHLFNEPNPIFLAPLSFLQIPNWHQYLAEGQDSKTIQQIKANTLTGRPSGSKAFISHFEQLLGIRLTPLPEGRPKINEKTSVCP